MEIPISLLFTSLIKSIQFLFCLERAEKLVQKEWSLNVDMCKGFCARSQAISDRNTLRKCNTGKLFSGNSFHDTFFKSQSRHE